MVSGCAYLEFPLPETETTAVPESELEPASLPDQASVPDPDAPPEPALPVVGTPPRKPPLDDIASIPGDGAAPRTLLKDPARLVGLGEGQVVAHLGVPEKVRHEGPAMIWRYAASQCWMDVFFFADLATGDRQVLTYEIEARQLGGQPDAIGRCMQLIQSESGERG